MLPTHPIVAVLRRNWGYLCAALGSIVTFFLLFEPWVGGGGADGRILANAFGKLTITTSLVSMWSGAPPRSAQINGTYAVLASVACAVTLFAVIAVVINLQGRTQMLSRVAVGASLAMAFFVVVIMVHLNGKAGEIRGMLGSGSPRDLGTQVGMIIRWASGNGSYPIPGMRRVSYTTAGLLSPAWWAGAISLISAVAALAQWARENGSRSWRLAWRLPTITIAPQPHTEPKPAAQASSDTAGVAKSDTAGSTTPEQDK